MSAWQASIATLEGLLILGFLLGLARPALSLALLVGIVGVCPSFPWQLGFPNLAYPFAYFLGLLGAMLVRAGSIPPVPRGGELVTGAYRATVLTLMVASVLALVRLRHLEDGAFSVAMRDAWEEGWHFNPSGIGGMLQALLIAVGGLVVFRAAASLGTSSDRALVRRGLFAGITLTLFSPLLQYVLGWRLLIRPDWGYRAPGEPEVTGLTGFFQDPHSLAAYLVLALGLCLGTALGRIRRSRWAVAGDAAVVLGILILLNYTNSRNGMLCGILVILVIWIMHLPLVFRRRQTPREGRRRTLLVAAPLAALVATILLLSVPALRHATYTLLTGTLGNARMWEPLSPGGPTLELLKARPRTWRMAGQLIERNPLWGTGPAGYYRLTEEHAHNYYLEFAADYGVVAAGALVFLFGTVMAVTARGAARQTSAAGRGLLTGIVAGEAGFLSFGLLAHPLLLPELQAVFWTVAGLGVSVALGGDGSDEEAP